MPHDECKLREFNNEDAKKRKDSIETPAVQKQKNIKTVEIKQPKTSNATKAEKICGQDS